MRRVVMMVAAAALTAVLVLWGFAAAQTAPQAANVATPVTAYTLATPAPVPGSDGRVHILYELIVTNVTGFPATIERIDVLGGSGAVVGSLAGPRLVERMRAFGSTTPTDALGPGQAGFVGVALVFQTAADVPASLVHRITVGLRGKLPAVFAARTTALEARTRVDSRPAVVLGPPLEGRWAFFWHFGAILPVDGALYFAQRYALDTIGLDAENRAIRPGGTPKVNADHIGYGKRLLAVADGTVVSVLDGLPDRPPLIAPSDTNLMNVTGNHVVLDVGEGRFVFYAHMKPGSVRVHLGDRVRRGDVLGLVGNSGNTTGPHLHIHVADGASPLASNGLPYVFDKFTVVGTTGNAELVESAIGRGKPIPVRAAGGGPKTSALPTDGTIADMP